MERFGLDNTEGYTFAELAFMNDQFAREMARVGDGDMPDDVRKSYEDRLAELILLDMDAGRHTEE